MTRDHLSRAAEYIAKGDGWYSKAADEIIAARKEDVQLTWKQTAEKVNRSDSWCRRLVAERTKVIAGEQAGVEVVPDWHQRGSHGTKAEIEAGARKLLASPGEAKKLFASLPPEAQKTVAKAVVATPQIREEVANAQLDRLRHGTVEPSDPKYPLLHRIEGDRMKLRSAAELMAGHWHDGRHDVSDTQLRLVRDTMAEAVIEVEKIVIDALRATDEKEARR
jgi:hypothetical protein